MALKSRVHHPPGGWVFYQPESNWNAPEWLSFDQLVQAIIQHRQSNPRFNLSTDRAAVEQELENYTEARLRAMPGGDQFLLPGASSPPNFPLPPHRRVRGAAAAVVKNAVAGAGALVDWLGSGAEPVAEAVAHHRAEICATCEFNQDPTVAQAVMGAAAEAFKLLVNLKNELRLSTPRDSQLKVCSICSCKLALKVFAPLEHVIANTPEDVFSKFPPHCWQIIEKAAAST